jgi:5-methylcytosine-specific restriction endonuclease McrA
MKDKILKLRFEGKTYNEIVNLVGCSKSTVAYHCGVGQREKSRIRKQRLLSDKVIANKLYHFRNKNVRSKARDFQRRVEHGYLSNKATTNFTVDQALEKLGNNPVCYLSGVKIDLSDTKSYQFDHVLPASKGGSNEIDNLGILCRDVNCMKHDLTVDELINWCKKILRYSGYKIVRIKGEQPDTLGRTRLLNDVL